MEERNITRYRLEQSNKKVYILTTSLINDKIKILCQDSNSQNFIGLFTLIDLLNISQYFEAVKSVEQIQKYLNGIIERQRVEIIQTDMYANFILHLINNDDISIPLTKQETNNTNQKQFAKVSLMANNSNEIDYSNINHLAINNNQNSEWYIYEQNPNQILANQNYITNNNLEIPNANDYIRTDVNLNNEKKKIYNNNTFNNKKLNSPPLSKSSSYSQVTAHSVNNPKNKVMKDINKIKPQQDKISKELKIVSKQVEQCMKDIIFYKEENDKLTKESALLKKENGKLKNQIEDFKKTIKEYALQTNSLKNEFSNIQKNISSSQEKNIELIKLNEEYENENEDLKNNLDIFEKENAELKAEIEKLKKNLINAENDKEEIKNGELFKNEELLKQNDNLENKLNLITKENSALKSEVEKLKKNLKNAENKKEEIKNKELLKQNDNLKNELNLILKENSALKSEVEKLKKNLKNAENKKEEIKNKELLKQNDNLKNELNIITKENSALKSEFEKLKKNIQISENNKQEIKDLKDELSKYRINLQEKELLKNQVINLEAQIRELMQEKQEEEEEEEINNNYKPNKGNQVEGDIIHNLKELELITKKINKKNKKLIIQLLYKASIDSDKAAAFHKKCDSAKNTIVLIETKNGKRFGGYTSCSWSGNCVEKGDSKAFIFSFDKMKTYDNIPGEDAIGCYPKFGPVFLGCQIKIFDDAFTKGGSTFERELNFETEEDYELTGGQRNFEVKDIEVYEVVFEKL